jgi:multicomponent Na+:H+ antiporter subunit B
VTAVLVIYRGFDTFGEAVVVFAAAVAVLAVLGREVTG